MFIAIISDTYGEIKGELVDKSSDIQLSSFIKQSFNNIMIKLNLKQSQIIDIQNAITIADINKVGKIEFVEFRNSLRVSKRHLFVKHFFVLICCFI